MNSSINRTTTNFILRNEDVSMIVINWSKDDRFDVYYRCADCADGSKAELRITSKKTGKVRIEGKRITAYKWGVKKYI
jgi:hypothetical protein